MAHSRDARAARRRRHLRIRKQVKGTAGRPRLSVFRSLSHIHAQIIDDERGETMAAASDLEKELASQVDGKNKTEKAALTGALIARRAKDKGVTSVVFDRGGYKFHGRVKALAEACRAEGLIF
ncbi:MAG: 50S ribosomal protein L18 [Chloroflexi bacterium]|nr:50S ribosomal protein L18 [Chloroflexota bacterium]